MKNNCKLILYALGFSIASFFTQGYADVIALQQEQLAAPGDDVLAPPPAAAKPSTVEPASQPTPKTKKQQLSPQVKTLLDWFNWVKDYPQSVTSKELTTLHTLIAQTSQKNIKKTITPSIQNDLAITLEAISQQKDILSPAGKRLFSIISQKRNQIAFLSQKQLNYTIKTLLPAVTPKAPTAPVQAEQPAPTPAAPAVATPATRTTVQTQASAPEKAVQPQPAKSAQILPRPVSYAANINAILKLKKASKIITELIALLDQAGTKTVDTATLQAFTTALNSLIKNSKKFNKTLHEQFTLLVAKSYHSNFLDSRQKPHIQVLYNALIAHKPTK